jgi:hypothetical protein
MKIHKYSLTFILVLLLSICSYAQLDSVWHQGPQVGSIPGGAVQITDNFPTYLPDKPMSEFRVIPEVEPQYPVFGEMVISHDEASLPPYFYVEDSNTGNNHSRGTGGSVLINSFLGFNATNAIPPDPTMAVGPNHIIACVNGFPSFFRIFDKSGNVLKTVNAAAFWNPIWPEENGDPQVIYDHFAGRWVLAWMQINTGNLTAGTLIAYSENDNPIGTWYIYRLPLTSWGDYPQIGFDEEAIYITTQNFSFGGSYMFDYLRIIDKAELYASNAGPLTYVDFWNYRTPNQGAGGQVVNLMHSVYSYQTGTSGWFVWAARSGANYYSVLRVLNPTSNTPRLRGRTFPVPFYSMAPNANQLGGGTPLEANGSHLKIAPILRDNLIYFSHSVRNTTFNTYGSAKYAIFDINSLTITEQAELGAQGYFYLYPTIAVDENHNIAVTFSRSADTEYVGAYYSTKSAGDPPGLSPSVLIRAGAGNYQQVASGRNRWGDYMGIYLDPSNFHDIFMHTEYAAATNTWATYIAHVIAAPYSGTHAYAIPTEYDFNDVETGTTSLSASIIIANYGDTDLTISNIPATFGDFNLETGLSFPVTLSTYDSLMLEFSFSPTTTGTASVNYPISTNDPQFTGINLNGNGYDLSLAIEKTFYASSGTQNSGNILTINSLTGSGTTIGPSQFTEVTSIAISPDDGKIYGMVSGSSSADIIKINSNAGDGYVFFTLNIPLMAAIAFDTSGVLYGVTRSGDVYTIDLSAGTSSFVVDAVGSYLGMTFHPETNELWATSRAITLPNREAIFKVNLSTGDTTIVGYTGLGKQTNDISFDENLNLFGIIGTPSEVTDFVGINTSTGVGTVIGSVGFNNLLSLTYVESVVSSAGDDNNSNIIPDEFILKQNYPNPFNPETKIEFSIPVVSDVKLTIYNLLGQEVAVLLERELNSGFHTVNWNASNGSSSSLSSGIYFYELKASGINGNNFNEIRKMILLK